VHTHVINVAVFRHSLAWSLDYGKLKRQPWFEIKRARSKDQQSHGYRERRKIRGQAQNAIFDCCWSQVWNKPHG